MKPQISQSHENVDDNVFEINGIYYTKNEDRKSLSVTPSRTKYNGTVNIPARVTFKGTSFRVTSIGDSAFEDCSGLNFVTIPDTVISIDDWAFEGCSGLTVVSIPDSVTTIGDWAFKDCSGLSSVLCHHPRFRYFYWRFGFWRVFVSILGYYSRYYYFYRRIYFYELYLEPYN